MLPPLPSSLGVVRPYLDRSLELATAAPIVAHQLRVLAMHVALQLPRDAAARRFLTALMHQLETDAQLLGESGEAPAVEAPIRRMALDLFAKATTADNLTRIRTPAISGASLRLPRLQSASTRARWSSMRCDCMQR